jgi:hypothetical protein
MAKPHDKTEGESVGECVEEKGSTYVYGYLRRVCGECVTDVTQVTLFQRTS